MGWVRLIWVTYGQKKPNTLCHFSLQCEHPNRHDMNFEVSTRKVRPPLGVAGLQVGSSIKISRPKYNSAEMEKHKPCHRKRTCRLQQTCPALRHRGSTTTTAPPFSKHTVGLTQPCTDRVTAASHPSTTKNGRNEFFPFQAVLCVCVCALQCLFSWAGCGQS